MAVATLRNDEFVDGIIGPSVKMLGPVVSGGTIVFETAPGCWGPMITPRLRGGHELNVPVAVEGAKVGDAIAIKIENIEVKSKATSSGIHRVVEGAFNTDPYVDKKCPKCGEPWPNVVLEGIGIESIKCAKCGGSASPFRMVNGYTMVFDEARTIGVTVSQEAATKIAKEAYAWSMIPKKSIQVSILTSASADLVGIVSRCRPFMGQLGTTPSVNIPGSYNAGDSGARLVGTNHPYAITQEQLEKCLTDGHLDVDSVRKGAVLIAPVKIEGGGIYAGDMHAMQGDGEVAGHTADVAGTLTVKVDLIKGLTLDGPILLPLEEDLSPLTKPFTSGERDAAGKLAKAFGLRLEESAPIQVIGVGSDLNKATANGFERASKLLGMSLDEVRNRVTISGGVKIGRLRGVVQVNILVPLEKLEKIGLAETVRNQYSLSI
jgi:acetamidase/formamidase